jgi:hypothetical protein
MCPIRRVDGERAGASALGILVPPSRRTVLIVRPRTLAWDLVLTQPGGGFREMNREEAEHVAFQVAAGLENSQNVTVEPVYSLDEGGSWLRVRIGPYSLTLCARVPGQPYKSLLFSDTRAMRAAVEAVTPLLCPPQGVEQELYVNTHHFTRPR